MDSIGDLPPAFNHQIGKEKEGSFFMEIFSVREACFSSGRHGALYTVNWLYLGLQPFEEERKGFGPKHHFQLSASSALWNPVSEQFHTLDLLRERKKPTVSLSFYDPFIMLPGEKISLASVKLCFYTHCLIDSGGEDPEQSSWNSLQSVQLP